MDSKNIGHRLRQFRKDAHLTQTELAKKASITPTYLSILERGVQLPRLETFITLANTLGVSANELLIDQYSDVYDEGENQICINADGLTEEQSTLIKDTLRLLCDLFKENNL